MRVASDPGPKISRTVSHKQGSSEGGCVFSNMAELANFLVQEKLIDSPNSAALLTKSQGKTNAIQVKLEAIFVIFNLFASVISLRYSVDRVCLVN